MKTIIVLLLTALILLASTALADGITLSQRINQTEVPFNDSVEFQIILKWDGPQTAYIFEDAISPDFDRFKVGSFSSTIGSTGKGDSIFTTKTLTYILIPQLSGVSKIRSTAVSYTMWPDGEKGELMTDAMSITIADPVARVVTEKTFPILRILFLLSIAIVIAVVIFIIIRKKKNTETVVGALDEFLGSLPQLRINCGDDIKKFQTGFYNLLVKYIGEEYNLEFDRKPLKEICDALETTKMSPNEREQFSQWLVRADKEKYSPDSSAPGETVRLESEILQFFEKTVLK